MSSARERVPFLLLEAELTLYPADANGAPVLASPIWFGACASNVSIRENWIGVETRPGGREHPRRRAQVAQYSIDIERVWLLQKADLDEFEAGPGPYVLSILWTDEDGGYWHRKTYYGVTPAERRWSGGASDSELRDSQQWNAEQVVSESGGGAPPVITPTVPLVVRWVAAGDVQDLYTHNASLLSFTEASAGITTGRATLVYTPGGGSGNFEVIFASGSTVAMRVTAARVLEVGELVVGVPRSSDQPRLDFMVGTTRIASLTQTKKLFVAGIDEVTALAAGANQFSIRANSLLSLVISAAGAGCVEARESL